MMKGARLAGLGALLCMAMATGRATASEPLTAQGLADKAAIENLIARFYNNFGPGAAARLGEFIAEDGEMVLGTNSFVGLQAIKDAYAAMPTDTPVSRAFALTVLPQNMIVSVSGDTAKVRLTYTEYLIDKKGDPPRLVAMGREFSSFVKRDGKWMFKKRHIMGANEVPEGWED
jgi:hypothetical protein